MAGTLLDRPYDDWHKGNAYGPKLIGPDGTHRSYCDCVECWHEQNESYRQRFGAYPRGYVPPGHDREEPTHRPDCACPSCILKAMKE